MNVPNLQSTRIYKFQIYTEIGSTVVVYKCQYYQGTITHEKDTIAYNGAHGGLLEHSSGTKTYEYQRSSYKMIKISKHSVY